MSDPSYVKTQIESRPDWDLAFVLSEIMNDNAPIGWSKYISTAQCLLAHYDIKPRISISCGGTMEEKKVLTALYDPKNDNITIGEFVSKYPPVLKSGGAEIQCSIKGMCQTQNPINIDRADLKTIGTLTWEACKNCCRIVDDCEFPSLYREVDTENIGCADYLSTEEGVARGQK